MSDGTNAVRKVAVRGPSNHVEILIPEADAETVFQWQQSGELVLIDVRETDEYAAEYVPGSILSPLSMFEPELFPAFPGKKVVLLCAIGKRSAAAARQLAKSGYYSMTNLTGGLQAWKDAGCPTVER